MFNLDITLYNMIYQRYPHHHFFANLSFNTAYSAKK